MVLTQVIHCFCRPYRHNPRARACLNLLRCCHRHTQIDNRLGLAVAKCVISFARNYSLQNDKNQWADHAECRLECKLIRYWVCRKLVLNTHLPMPKLTLLDHHVADAVAAVAIVQGLIFLVIFARIVALNPALNSQEHHETYYETNVVAWHVQGIGANNRLESTVEFSSLFSQCAASKA